MTDKLEKVLTILALISIISLIVYLGFFFKPVLQIKGGELTVCEKCKIQGSTFSKHNNELYRCDSCGNLFMLDIKHERTEQSYNINSEMKPINKKSKKGK